MRNELPGNAGFLNTGLYGLTVLIWGTTWIAMTFQLGPVVAELSVAYRFAIAALVVFVWALAARQRLRGTIACWRRWASACSPSTSTSSTWPPPISPPGCWRWCSR